MIQKRYGDIALHDTFHHGLLAIIKQYDIPSHTQRIILNFRETSYYRTKEGLHPVEIQLYRISLSTPWQLICLTSFSYSDTQSHELEPELYFHLPNLWCYQPDCGAVSLEHPKIKTLLEAWMQTLACHLTQCSYDDIQLTMTSTFDATS
ncbi:DUF2787 family protein [Vibrio splendidus]|jgi:hypothetical protein|uniref:DUF2787 domain-containing protein n=1 Tax=Vibrio splendidus 12E03 TaxID=1191305 RepID=A0A1E5FRU0_VIBSP|nr:DUF2787 family protein [Vibrio splendidus]OEF93172.1 hypothetical protein A142_00885 [Vibrio splendidus 12E03]